jgi:hypothetical protein
MSDENPPPHPRVMNGCVDATVFRCLLWILTLFARVEREEERACNINNSLPTLHLGNNNFNKKIRILNPSINQSIPILNVFT